MRKDAKGKGPGKVIAKNNLPEKICVVCNRPFTWRKKWERVWDEVTTCSKSCNAKRKTMAKQSAVVDESPPDGGSATALPINSTDSTSSHSDGEHAAEDGATLTKQMLRKQHKEAVKAQKRERRAKRMGDAPELGRKPCDLCSKDVDLLVRCTVDETKTYFMVCGKCWPSVSGGVPDGDSSKFPHYQYGGLWKNRNANLKKRIGSGPKKNSSSAGAPSLLEEIEASIAIEDSDNEVD